MKNLYSTLILLFLISSVLPAQDCSDGRYMDEVFEDVKVISNVPYARKLKSNGVWQNLVYDVYLPVGDTETNRPAVMLAHGGGYIDFINQKSPDIVVLAEAMAKRGYVVFSPEYREEANPLALLSEERMVKAVARALLDIRDVTCHLMDTTILYGNPYGVDPENVFVGGVSAGAVSFLHAVFLDSINWVPQPQRDWILEVEPNTQYYLDNRYCGAKVRGIINISGAILDTAWIKPRLAESYPPVLSVHGTADPIVPYGVDRPFGLPNLPLLMGSAPIHERLGQIGVYCELETYEGGGHVPFLELDFLGLLTGGLLDFIFNMDILNPTIEQMAAFMYNILDCEEIPTGVLNDEITEILVYPNPVRNKFSVQLPASSRSAEYLVRVINQMGQVVLEQKIPSGANHTELSMDTPSGMYFLSIQEETGRPVYQSSLTVVR